MKRIWCVNVGEYEDSRPVAAFEDEETARAWAKALSGDVSSLELVRTGVAPYKRTIYRVLVYFGYNGAPVSRRKVEKSFDWEFVVEQSLFADYQSDCKLSMYFLPSGWRGDPRSGMLEVVGEDRSTVIAATNEQIRKWESGEWTPNSGPVDLEVTEGSK